MKKYNFHCITMITAFDIILVIMVIMTMLIYFHHLRPDELIFL